LAHAADLDREATVHVGVTATALERQGQTTERGDINRDIVARNEARAELLKEAAAIDAQIIDLDAERAKRAEARAILSAAKSLDPDRILISLTERKATFTRADLNRHLTELLPDRHARAAYMDRVLERKGVVPLRETEDAPVSRYTTQAVLRHEGEVFGNADRLHGNDRHGVNARRLADVLDHHSHLDAEQRRAVEHLTRSNGFAILAGQAGTGKTTTLAAVREIYEAEGYRVVGLSWQNSVVQRLKGDGFAEAPTISTALGDLDKGRDHWNPKTLLIVDEAAMLATKHLAPLVQRAVAAGAKVITAQDKQQLGSIERGGVAAALEGRYAPARLTKVYRAFHDDDKAAMNLMHAGDFRAALDLFDKRGSIHWQQTPEEARAALVAKWADITAADPAKRPLVIGYTNAEVHDLNRDLRAIRKERGELGDDHHLPVKDGDPAFAVGDWVQFTGSDRDRKRREAGLYNGAFGTITNLAEGRVTVALDGAKDAPQRVVSFVVGNDGRQGEFDAMRHGYASTTHKNQGNTEYDVLVSHSDHWRASSAYVALSRAREQTHLYASEKAAPWIMAGGGLEALTAQQRPVAERSYSAWAEAKPDLAARYDLPDYVAYVQSHWADTKDQHRLDRMAQQMGRTEENRAASQFVQGAKPPPPAEELTRIYRGIGKNVWEAAPGEALFFSTDAARASTFGKLHYVDVTAAELASFERPHSKRILDAEPTARNDLRTDDPDIISRLQPLEPARSSSGTRQPPLSAAASIVKNYLELCYDPAKDFVSWIAEHLRDNAAVRRSQLDKAGAIHDSTTTEDAGAILGRGERVRGEVLPTLQVRVDPPQQAGSSTDGAARANDLPAGSRSDSAKSDRLRQVRPDQAGTADEQWRDKLKPAASEVTKDEPTTPINASDYLKGRGRFRDRGRDR
jgi:ATP-dependent exoDNAse (exonuclease V) alpha subunit